MWSGGKLTKKLEPGYAKHKSAQASCPIAMSAEKSVEKDVDYKILSLVE